MNTKVNAELIEKVSKNTGKPYLCIEIKLTNNLTKTVFLDKAEEELVRLLLAQTQNK